MRLNRAVATVVVAAFLALSVTVGKGATPVLASDGQVCGNPWNVLGTGTDVVTYVYDYYAQRNTAVHIQEQLWYQVCDSVYPGLQYAMGEPVTRVYSEDYNPYTQWHINERVGFCRYPTCDNSFYYSTKDFQFTGNQYGWVAGSTIYVGYTRNGNGFWGDDWAPSSYTWWSNPYFSQTSGTGQYSYVSEGV